jgi:hypothetical protein
MAGRSWTCARCGMTTSFQKGSPKRAKPDGWAKEGKDWHCLRCRRELVMEKAVADQLELGERAARQVPERARRADPRIAHRSGQVEGSRRVKVLPSRRKDRVRPGEGCAKRDDG